MALSASTVYQIQSTATSGNVNSGGFNPANTSMLTDGAATSATGNSPVFSSASYNFVAGDVGHWLYIKSGTDWTPGWYQIASVAANNATLSAAIGDGIQVNNNRYGTQTVAGVATTASPTGATWAIDYSQSDTSPKQRTDLVLATTTTLTSAAIPFGPQEVGNLIHTTAGSGFTVGWYEIVSVSGTTATIDRVGGTLSSTGGTGYVGGALSLGSSDDAVFELAVSSSTAAARYFIKGGSNVTYTLGGTVALTAAGNNSWPIIWEGFVNKRGDRPTAATRPVLNAGAAAVGLNGSNYRIHSINFTSTASNAVTLVGSSVKLFNIKVTNLSTIANRVAINLSGGNCYLYSCEAISCRGYGISIGSNTNVSQVIDSCWVHDCARGFYVPASVDVTIINSISSSNVTAALEFVSVSNQSTIANNTFYGAENKQGTGVIFASGVNNPIVINNIIYGFGTGISHADTNAIGYDNNNNYYNNTSDVSSTTQWQKGPNDISLDPQFTNVVQRTGSTATTASSNVFTQSGATFQTWGVTAGQDYIYIKSGTGVTAGIYGILSVDSETQLTLNMTLSANTTADKVWQITQGNNFAVGTNMKATGYPGLFPGGFTTGYLDVGAVQRQEPAGGSGGSFTFS